MEPVFEFKYFRAGLCVESVFVSRARGDCTPRCGRRWSAHARLMAVPR